MSDTQTPPPSAPPPPAQQPGPPSPPRAHLRRPTFPLVWFIPLLAAMIAGYLGYRTFLEQGPLLTLTFSTADGLQAGQTQVKYKAVALGTVESIGLSPDNSHVIVRVRMTEVGSRFLTSHARFWVERPRFTLSDTTGLETLVSGAYITLDPGTPGGASQRIFTGLEQPPGVRSDQPGRVFTLTTADAGALNSGSPVFFHGATVGEVLGYDLGTNLTAGSAPVKISIFIHAPYDDLVRPDSRFWDSSGIAAGIQGGVLQVQLQSVQALVAGGVSFSLPDWAASEAPSADGASFPLYASQEAAQAAGYRTQVPIVAYFTGNVAGLTQGAPVDMLGIQVGDVTDVSLQVDPTNGTARVRVAMAVQPERVVSAAPLAGAVSDTQAAMARMVAHGLRAGIGTESYVTGQKLINLDFAAGTPPATATQEGDALVLPSNNSSLDEIVANATDISAKLDKLPYAELADNLNKLLTSSAGTLQSLGSGFGPDSDVQRQLLTLLQETTQAVQSLNALSTELDRHPNALLLGRNAP